jgi:dienelactone hydrolase
MNPKLAGALLLLAALAPAAAHRATDAQAESAIRQVAGPQGPEEGELRRQLWMVPLPGERLMMRTLMFRPRGAGPFPLAVINHGSDQSSVRRANGPQLSDYRNVGEWFLARGFAVALPLRPGHGETGGPYFEDQGRCESADYLTSGLATADSIQAAVDYLTAQPFLRKSGVVVVGQSAGGWGALALASRNPAAVTAVINFAGGRGGRSDDQPNNNCVPERLVATAGTFGGTARIPTLWLYSENDSYFGPALSKGMDQAFRDAGGRADFHLLPPLPEDGHRLISSDAAAPLWTPILDRFLAEHP